MVQRTNINPKNNIKSKSILLLPVFLAKSFSKPTKVRNLETNALTDFVIKFIIKKDETYVH